jgi:hypothetical protein
MVEAMRQRQLGGGRWEVGGSAEVGDGELEDGVAALGLEEEIRRWKGMMSPSSRTAL